MKYLVLLAILVLAWVLFFKSRRGPSDRPPDGPPGAPPPKAKDAPTAIIACAHCGLHLPQAEAQFDVAGRPYCGQAHRLAGPR